MKEFANRCDESCGVYLFIFIFIIFAFINHKISFPLIDLTSENPPGSSLPRRTPRVGTRRTYNELSSFTGSLWESHVGNGLELRFSDFEPLWPICITSPFPAVRFGREYSDCVKKKKKKNLYSLTIFFFKCSSVVKIVFGKSSLLKRVLNNVSLPCSWCDSINKMPMPHYQQVLLWTNFFSHLFLLLFITIPIPRRKRISLSDKLSDSY